MRREIEGEGIVVKPIIIDSAEINLVLRYHRQSTKSKKALLRRPVDAGFALQTSNNREIAAKNQLRKSFVILLGLWRRGRRIIVHFVLESF